MASPGHRGLGASSRVDNHILHWISESHRLLVHHVLAGEGRGEEFDQELCRQFMVGRGKLI